MKQNQPINQPDKSMAERVFRDNQVRYEGRECLETIRYDMKAERVFRDNQVRYKGRESV